jgi:DNA-binding transcriptional LysR family regulator
VRQAGLAGSGALAIGLTPSASHSPLIEALQCYRNDHPEIELNMHELFSNDMGVALRSRKIDVALMRPCLDDCDIKIIIVYEEPICVVTRKDALLAGQRMTLEQICTYPILNFETSTSPYFRNILYQLFAGTNLSPRLVQESSFPTILTLVEAGVGIAIAPLSMAKSRSETLSFTILAGVGQVTAKLGVATLHNSSNPLVDNFIGTLQTHPALFLSRSSTIDISLMPP